MTSTSSATDSSRESAATALPEPAEGSMTSTGSVTDLVREPATSPLPELAEGSTAKERCDAVYVHPRMCRWEFLHR